MYNTLKRIFTLGVFLLVATPLAAGMLGQSRDSRYNSSIPSASGYQGPGDVVSGATGWYGLRAYSSSQIGGTTKAVSLRRASDNTVCDFDINTSGNLGGTDSGCGTGTGLSLAIFATTDATATCTIATTTATCTSGSGVPHAGSTITGAGLTQPCYGPAAGSGTSASFTVTVSGNGSASPCGTISVGETLTFTYGLFVTKAYDQSGTGNDVAQATTGSQPYLLPTCINSLPCLASPTISRFLSATIASTANASIAAVAQRNASFTTVQIVIGKSNVATLGFYSSANTITLNSASQLAAVADQSPHAMQGVYGATSYICADGNCMTAAVTAPTAGTGLGLMSAASGSTQLAGFVGEAGFWATTTFTPTQITSQCHNAYLYWDTPPC